MPRRIGRLHIRGRSRCGRMASGASQCGICGESCSGGQDGDVRFIGTATSTSPTERGRRRDCHIFGACAIFGVTRGSRITATKENGSVGTGSFLSTIMKAWAEGAISDGCRTCAWARGYWSTGRGCAPTSSSSSTIGLTIGVPGICGTIHFCSTSRVGAGTCTTTADMVTMFARSPCLSIARSW